jgi:hypothetical protein
MARAPEPSGTRTEDQLARTPHDDVANWRMSRPRAAAGDPSGGQPRRAGGSRPIILTGSLSAGCRRPYGLGYTAPGRR